MAALITRDATTRDIVVPDLPIAFNNDFAQAPLGKDRLMILGGSNCSYRGCKDAWAKTHILDLARSAPTVERDSTIYADDRDFHGQSQCADRFLQWFQESRALCELLVRASETPALSRVARQARR